MDNGYEVSHQVGEQDSRPGDAVDRGVGAALRPEGGTDLALPNGVHFLELDAPKLARLGKRILSIPGLFDDRIDPVATLATLLLRRDTLFFELDNEAGIVYAEGVEKGGSPIVHVVVFNRRSLPRLDSQLAAIVAWGFALFDFVAISAWIPEHNWAARQLASRLDWTYDGLLRGYAVHRGKREDVFIYSVTKQWALANQSSNTS